MFVEWLTSAAWALKLFNKNNRCHEVLMAWRAEYPANANLAMGVFACMHT